MNLEKKLYNPIILFACCSRNTPSGWRGWRGGGRYLTLILPTPCIQSNLTKQNLLPASLPKQWFFGGQFFSQILHQKHINFSLKILISTYTKDLCKRAVFFRPSKGLKTTVLRFWFQNRRFSDLGIFFFLQPGPTTITLGFCTSSRAGPQRDFIVLGAWELHRVLSCITNPNEHLNTVIGYRVMSYNLQPITFDLHFISDPLVKLAQGFPTHPPTLGSHWPNDFRNPSLIGWKCHSRSLRLLDENVIAAIFAYWMKMS
jgi:hypothetical protein